MRVYELNCDRPECPVKAWRSEWPMGGDGQRCRWAGCGGTISVTAHDNGRRFGVSHVVHEGPCLNWPGQQPEHYDEYDSCYLHLDAAAWARRCAAFRDRLFACPECGQPDAVFARHHACARTAPASGSETLGNGQ